jgi:hypothetical protein
MNNNSVTHEASPMKFDSAKNTSRGINQQWDEFYENVINKIGKNCRVKACKMRKNTQALGMPMRIGCLFPLSE